MIKFFLIIISFGVCGVVLAQQDPVLMRINGKEVLRSEFEGSYNKDKASLSEKQNSPDKYIDRFVNFRLKVLAAEAAGIDTTLAFKKEQEVHRRQLTESYLIDEEAVERAASQAYDRMKDNHQAESVRVSHIFKSIPQNVSGNTLRLIEARMDSIYIALQKNGTAVAFDTYVEMFSDDKRTFWVNKLQMPVEFEDTVFRLQVGEVSRPFLTPQGVHIVKVLARKELLPFEKMKNEIIFQQVQRLDPNKGTETFVERLKHEYNYTLNKAGVDELLSVGHTDQSLFVLDGKTYTGKDFLRFAMAHPAGVRRQLDGFIIKSILDYENSRLEQKHPELHHCLQDFRDNLLLDIITEKKFGKQVSADESELRAYFENHRSDYHWDVPRYRGIVLHCTTKRVAKRARKFLKTLPAEDWKDAIRLTFNADGQQQVQAEQGLFAVGDNEFVDALVFKVKKVTPVVSFPFFVVTGEKLKGPEGFQEVREAVVADYQDYQERRWIAELRASSKVEINQEVLKTVNNH